ncbi:site-specific integrase [Gaetbulibacter sp. M235]|uniref:site-specific integrase n=1 Tax=Gaetbulibacter sp. M235 TaxID=3126510 RepID=UPI00374E636E
MINSFSLLFYIKKSKSDSLGRANIYLRITVDGKRAELSINRKIHVNNWNSHANLSRGNNYESQEINRHIATIKNKIYSIEQQLINKGKHITAQGLKNLYLGIDTSNKMLLEIFKDHNNKVNRLVGKDFAPGTAERYKTAKKHIEEYIRLDYKSNDIPVREVDHKFINGFEYYLKTVRNCSHNTTIKYITNFKKIIRIAYANDWINKDPFYNWKARLKIVDREFLTEEEIQKMVEKEFHTTRLDIVKDIFIFCCFTGLAYADVKKLSKNDLVIGIDGERWIKTNRAKTDIRSNIPLLPTAESILKKYKAHSEMLNNGTVLPVLSNQKMNAYLKEIGDLCEINKNLTFHLARHTFATTVTLTNGVPIESVSKMLGHKSLKTTQHYAKILDRKVSEDMKTLRDRFQQKEALDNASNL